ncbi:MAG: hypothetical protein Ct9H90mP18_01040 [Gammaproteobacteria bacterium]|nr:MAG: hypothetical protein Ct9H90mP18_01040 [Gammaproteobacteria bacterium]
MLNSAFIRSSRNSFWYDRCFSANGACRKKVDPSVLPGGIWEALLTTAAGLSVAIPIVVAESYFRTLVERFKSNLENSFTRVFTAISINHNIPSLFFLVASSYMAMDLKNPS